jgi:hypothetical protein
VPVLMTGTMGAVIGMEGSRADRKQLFAIGISGPWAGLIFRCRSLVWHIGDDLPCRFNWATR